MKKLSVRGVLIILTFIYSISGASASTYIGGGLGKATWDLKPVLGSYELEDSIALRLFGGIRSGNLGGEAELSFSSHDWKYFNGSASHNAGSIILSGVGYLPITSTFELYGKIGMNLWSTTVELLGETYEGDDGVDLAFGLGLNLKVTEELLIRLEYQSLPGLSDGLDEGDIKQYTMNFALNY